MNMRVEDRPEGRLIVMAGPLTINVAEQIRLALVDALNGLQQVVIDLAGISAVDTSGLQILLMAKRVDPARIRLENHSPALLRVLDLVQLHAPLDCVVAGV